MMIIRISQLIEALQKIRESEGLDLQVVLAVGDKPFYIEGISASAATLKGGDGIRVIALHTSAPAPDYFTAEAHKTGGPEDAP